MKPPLEAFFDRINEAHFDGFLDRPQLVYNARLRVCAGRFIPGSRRNPAKRPPTIEIAAYLASPQRLASHTGAIEDTMGHEIIHYWLWVRGRPYGHTDEFETKRRQMGV